MVKLYEALKKIKQSNFKNIQTVTHSTLYLSDNNIEIDINGIPSSIILSFTGTVRFVKKLPLDIKVKIGKRSILISNTFLKEIPKLIFVYSGNIKMYDCQIMNFDSSIIKAEIKNNQIEGIFNQSKTKMEDDTLRLVEDLEPIDRRAGKTGLISPVLDVSKSDIYGKFQKYGKRDVKKVAATITRLVPIRQNHTQESQQTIENPTSIPIASLDTPTASIETDITSVPVVSDYTEGE